MFDSVSRARGTAAFLEARKRRSERRGAQGANSEETKINLQDVQVVDLAAPRPHRVSLPGCAEKGADFRMPASTSRKRLRRGGWRAMPRLRARTGLTLLSLSAT
ncbi:unnamed protein product [Prorocentrum cordatum]|uniref:Uncharacterized protein n=1 Tax=Prorocentrum cordatum TaxID=2364126 RepID=A0ABN9R0F2_9DINO|nr:unnamed protein product [Polarella glacialis]